MATWYCILATGHFFRNTILYAPRLANNWKTFKSLKNRTWVFASSWNVTTPARLGIQILFQNILTVYFVQDLTLTHAHDTLRVVSSGFRDSGIEDGSSTSSRHRDSSSDTNSESSPSWNFNLYLLFNIRWQFCCV